MYKIFIGFIFLPCIINAQQIKDTCICISHHQAKVINLAFNELTRMIALDSVSKEQLGTKDLKIKQLQAINNMRSNQLIDANIEITTLKKELKIKSIKIAVYQVALLASLVGLVIAL
jgi:hypothetical protein